MKKMNSSYRLQVIKEVAQRRQRLSQSDEMSQHISALLEQRHQPAPSAQPFSNAHFDAHAGGWVSDDWNDLK